MNRLRFRTRPRPPQRAIPMLSVWRSAQGRYLIASSREDAELQLMARDASGRDRLEDVRFTVPGELAAQLAGIEVQP